MKVSTISTDRHTNSERNKGQYLVPCGKGSVKKLIIVARKRECFIINYLWWSVQTCDGNAEVLKKKWVSIIQHATKQHDWPGNRHYHRCAHEPFG